MQKPTQPAQIQEHPLLVRLLAWYAILGCVIFALCIVIADFVVPNHDMLADTISDLGAGRFEFIVDVGIYAFSASCIALALLAAHVHLGDWRWSMAIVGFAIMGLIVFLVGARNEYGDNDSEGVVIHVYLVYAIGALMTLLPLAMMQGAARVSSVYGPLLVGISALWTVSAPVFFFMNDAYDGIYERYLGLITFAFVISIARLFILRGRAMNGT